MSAEPQYPGMALDGSVNQRSEAAHHSAVVEAVRAGDEARLAALLDADPAALEARDERGVSALLLACVLERPDLVACFLERHPILDIFEAAAADLGGRVSELLDRDAGLGRAVSPDGLTPLHIAARFGSGSALRRLLRRGADPLAIARDGSGAHPLHLAAAAGHSSIVGALLDAGAKADARQADGRTPRDLAREAGNRDVVEELDERP
jgi:uncharacterized protein